MEEARERNAKPRELGTRNLVFAAAAAGVRQFIAQSVAFAYAPGLTPLNETAPLHLNCENAGFARTVEAVVSLESQVLSGPFASTALRYGRLCGPGTGFDAPSGEAAPHVDAAADAARRALYLGASGIFNCPSPTSLRSHRIPSAHRQPSRPCFARALRPPAWPYIVAPASIQSLIF
jgi:nucleoside-diphosphate-sugar epimerase